MAQETRSIVVTGASSGIGRATALRLARAQWRVFATVRSDKDGEALRREAGDALEPIRLDVTDQQSIAAAATLVEEKLAGRGLDALFNNAGVGALCPVEYMSPEALIEAFSINLFGQIAVIQAFLPTIRRARGRIVNAGSVADYLTPPFAGLLAGSKSAFAAMTAALRLELRTQGIHVILIEPGAINTPAVDKTLGAIDDTIAALPDGAAQTYGPAMRTMADAFARTERAGSSPDVVAKIVERALNGHRPRARYAAGKQSLALKWLAWALPDRLLDAVILKVFGLSAPAVGQSSQSG